MIRAGALALLAALATAPLHAALPVPGFAAYVTDRTGTLTAEQRQALEQRLARLAQERGSQVAVLIVPTTAPQTAAEYAFRVAEAWKLGRQGVDDGVLLLVAKDDRRVWITVGYGLEGAVPDAIAKRVVEEFITPRFRAGDFAGGIEAGVAQLVRVIEGEPLPAPRRASATARTGFDALLPVAIFVLIGAQIFGRLFGKLPASLAGGGLFGAISATTFGTVLAGGIGGGLMFIVLLVVLLNGGGRGRGGWIAPVGWGGSRGGWGGGGFGGGGGGRFGGGGAGGSW